MKKIWSSKNIGKKNLWRMKKIKSDPFCPAAMVFFHFHWGLGVNSAQKCAQRPMVDFTLIKPGECQPWINTPQTAV